MFAWSNLFTTALTATLALTASAAPIAKRAGKIQYSGVNIAGFDFCMDTNGACASGSPTVSVAQGTGASQMTQFVKQGMNAFRLPVGWQYLTAGSATPNQLNQNNFQTYDQLVQQCISSGAAMCIVDIHNYARYNGAVVGQGGPTDQVYSQFWAQLASKYKNNSKVAFDLMNEPHDLNIQTWATTLQTTVSAIRATGATSNTIFLPGMDYSSLGAFQYNSGPALLKVKDADGTTDKLIFTVHQYLDADGSGTASTCTQNGVSNINNLATWLRSNGRKAMLLETGGGNTPSCVTNVGAEITALNANSDTFMGVTMWAAGAFQPSYPLFQSANAAMFPAPGTSLFAAIASTLAK